MEQCSFPHDLLHNAQEYVLRVELVNTRSSSPTGQGSDHAMLLSSISTLRNDRSNNGAYAVTNLPPADVSNPAYAVPNLLITDGVIYEDLPSEDVTVNTPAVTAFTGDGRYSKLQRESSLLTQSVASTITGDDNVEAYYGRLDNSGQYIVSIAHCTVM